MALFSREEVKETEDGLLITAVLKNFTRPNGNGELAEPDAYVGRHPPGAQQVAILVCRHDYHHGRHHRISQRVGVCPEDKHASHHEHE